MGSMKIEGTGRTSEGSVYNMDDEVVDGKITLT